MTYFKHWHFSGILLLILMGMSCQKKDSFEPQTAILGSAGNFDFYEPYALPHTFSLTPSCLLGDIDGDGDEDLIAMRYDHPTTGNGKVQIFTNEGNAQFQALYSFTFPRDFRTTGFNAFPKINLADLNGDGRQDLVCQDFNELYVALAGEDGIFEVEPKQTLSVSLNTLSPEEYRLRIADVNGDGQDELLWNKAEGNHIYVGWWNGDMLLTGPWEHPEQQHPDWSLPFWRNTTFTSRDFDGDQRADLAWVAMTVDGSGSRLWIASANDGGNFVDRGYVPIPDLNYCNNKKAIFGDFNGDGLSDVGIVRINDEFPDCGLSEFFFSQGDYAFERKTYNISNEFSDATEVRFLTGDMNGDGVEDLLSYSDQDIRVAYGSASNEMKLEPVFSPPITLERQVFLTDLNQDRKADILMLNNMPDQIEISAIISQH